MMTALSRWRRRKVPYVPQMEVAECGAACLSMVLGAHGCHVPLAEARQLCGVSRDGVNALSILRAASSLGCKARGAKLEASALHALPLPAVLHWDFNHFVVLESVSRRGAVIVDPGAGRKRVDRATLHRSFTGVAILVEPGEGFRRRNPDPAGGLSWLGLLRAASRPFVALLVATLLLEIAGALAPAGNQMLIDHVLSAHREKWFWLLVVGLGLATLTRGALLLLRERLLLGIQFALDVSMMSRLVDHMLHLPAPYFDQRTTGDLTQRVDASVALRDLTIRIGRAMLDLLLLLVYGALMLAYDLRLGLVVLGLNLLRVLTVLMLVPRGRIASSLELVARGREQGSVVEAFASPEVIKAFSSEQLIQRRYGERLTSRVERAQDRQRYTAALGAVSTIVQALIQGLVFWLGGRSVISHDMTLGTLAGFVTLQQLIGPSLDSVVGALAESAQARSIMARIDDVFSTPRAPSGAIEPGQLRGRVTFENVSFRYGPSSPWAIRHLSLDIHAGQKIAIVGRSGQGKSTLARLLLGIVSPTAGRVLIDGHDLALVNRSHLLSQVGVVLQDSFVLDDTVRANLLLRSPHASDQELWRAARMACLDQVISDLPHGLETPLGPAGRRLSGGQRQRMCLARALVGKPSLLVLDESTSALDEATEAQVHRNLASLSCTRVVIAHRLSTVRDADRILVVEGGEIVDSGTYEELVARPGVLRSMQAALA